MNRLFSIIFIIICLPVLSCIRNDIPYPEIDAAITQLDVDGANAVNISDDVREVLVTFGEAVDLRNVNIREVSFNDDVVTSSDPIVGTKDLSSPLGVTLKAYENEYVWTIKAEQPIERYFTLSGQVGETVIDAPNRRVVTQVSSSVGLDDLRVSEAKLGPEMITTYSPAISDLRDFEEPVTLTVSYRDISETWTIYVEAVESAVTISQPDVWTRVAWLKAAGVEGRQNGFSVRKAGDSEWREIKNITSDGGSFSATADGLEPLTEYECRAYSGEDVSEIVRFTTEAEVQLPNSGFETFSNVESDKYCSFYDPASPVPALQSKWWGSGNKGSTTVGSKFAITKPDDTEKVEGKYSLKMESQYVVIKFAAGNIFSGEYGGNVGTAGGKIRMGRPFTLRPRKMTVWLKYKSGKIQQKTLGGYPDDDVVKVGDNDRGIVWVALGTWDFRKYGGTADCPVEVNTTDKSTFFDPKGKDVIAYGKFVTDHDTEWTKVEIPLEYVSTSRRPTHIIVSCAASMLGDYFTGSPDSILWVDDLRLEY